jgi:hypothetical protein
VSDNVIEGMARCILAAWDENTTPREEAQRFLAHLAERGMVVLGPDGEPLDVRPALRALECWAQERRGGAHNWLTANGLPSPLADACLAAAEVEG